MCRYKQSVISQADGHEDIVAEWGGLCQYFIYDRDSWGGGGEFSPNKTGSFHQCLDSRVINGMTLLGRSTIASYLFTFHRTINKV